MSAPLQVLAAQPAIPLLGHVQKCYCCRCSTFAALRFSVAAVAFAPWLKEALKDRKVLKGGMELGLWSAIGYQTQSVGLITSEASRASFLSTFTVRSVTHCPCCRAFSQPCLVQPACHAPAPHGMAPMLPAGHCGAHPGWLVWQGSEAPHNAVSFCGPLWCGPLGAGRRSPRHWGRLELDISICVWPSGGQLRDCTWTSHSRRMCIAVGTSCAPELRLIISRPAGV